MMDVLADKAVMFLSEQALPLNHFSHPSIQFFLTELTDFRIETPPSALKRLLKKLASDKAMANRTDDLCDRYTNVSKSTRNIGWS